MKKLLKQAFGIILALIVIVPLVLTPISVTATSSSANTLAELRAELAAYEAKMKSIEASEAKTEAQISSSKTAISNAQTEIEQNQDKIEQAKLDIEASQAEIEASEEKIKNILVDQEITNGENVYLEYIFGATSISDFIVRYSVSQQLAKYYNDLIEEHENLIAENEALKIELAQREEELNAQIEKLEAAIDSLGTELDSYFEEAVDVEDDIESTKELIEYYEKMGCGENEDFNSCVSIRGDTGFIRPLVKGTITSNYGYRTHPVTGQKYKFHSGTDIGGNSEGTSVYAAANGMVGKIIRKASCGGNQVYIYHTINGVKYTTGYMHLLTINVSVGDTVTSNTVIGTVGGGAGTSSYETCSTGAHLHFMIGTGWYGSTYVSYSTWVSHLVDPTSIISFPSKGVWFYSRY